MAASKVGWTAWGILLAATTAGFITWAYVAVGRVTQASPTITVPGPDRRVMLPAGDIGFYYEYAGRAPSYRYEVPLPDMECHAVVVATGYSTPLSKPGRTDTYQVGEMTGLLVFEGTTRTEAMHDVGCTLKTPFQVRESFEVRVGQNLIMAVLGAMALPMAAYGVVLAGLVAWLVRLLKRR